MANDSEGELRRRFIAIGHRYQTERRNPEPLDSRMLGQTPIGDCVQKLRTKLGPIATDPEVEYLLDSLIEADEFSILNADLEMREKEELQDLLKEHCDRHVTKDTPIDQQRLTAQEGGERPSDIKVIHQDPVPNKPKPGST